MYMRTITALTLLAAGGVAVAAKTPTTQEMWEIIQRQQQELDQLKRQNQQLSEEVDTAGEMAERAQKQTGGADGKGGLGRTTIGGYGELHYNNLDTKDEVDFHRFVLFFGHHFTDSIRFQAELELEHALAGEGKEGEVELEQAFVEFDLNERHAAKVGVFLLPIGILNETHEPTTFYGVERNNVEKDIIPTTWWEGGAGLRGEFAPGWGYDVALTSGLNVGADFTIRGGRQKVSEARAKDGAITGRIKWTGVPGLELALSAQYQEDIRQSTDPTAGSATLWETHAIYQNGPIGVRALYARWDLDGSGPAALGRDEQEGWYIEPSYKITPKFGVFARYSEWDTSVNSAADTENRQADFGFNYWPHENVVLKADVQNQSGAVSNDGFNLGFGYHF